MNTSSDSCAGRYSPVSLQRISKVSRLLEKAMLGIILISPFVILLSWLNFDGFSQANGIKQQVEVGLKFGVPDGLYIESTLLLWQRMAGCAIVLATLSMGLTGLWHVRKCFLLFAEGKFFNTIVINHLRRFSAWTLAFVIASLLSEPALSVLLTINNTPGHRQLTLGISSDQILALLISGAVWLIAAVISHANALAEENAHFV